MTLGDLIRRSKEQQSDFDRISITGPGWSGNSKIGFMCNPESGCPSIGGGAPSFICPDVATLFVTFDGITLDCDCVDTSVLTDPSSIRITSGTMDGTYQVDTFDVGKWSGSTGAGLYTRDYWNSPVTDCSGDPTGTAIDENMGAVVWCGETGFNVLLSLGGLSAFLASGVQLDTPAGNTVACGDVVTDPFPGYGDSVFIAHGGTATVSTM